MSCNNVQILNFNHNIVEVGPDNKIVITDQIKCNSITIPQPVTNILQINSPGPQGPQGAPGGGIDTSIFATTGSNNFIGNQNILGNTTITGSLTVSGSNTFRNIGPAIFSGSINVTDGITGSLQGIATGVAGGTNNYIPLWSGSNTLVSSIMSEIPPTYYTVNVNNMDQQYGWYGYNSVYEYSDYWNNFGGGTIVSSTTRSLTVTGDITQGNTHPLPHIWTDIEITDIDYTAYLNDYPNLSSIVFYSQSYDSNTSYYTAFYSSSIVPGLELPNYLNSEDILDPAKIQVNGNLFMNGSIRTQIPSTHVPYSDITQTLVSSNIVCSDNKVGIGLLNYPPTPREKLEVNGSGIFSVGTTGFLKLEGTSTNSIFQAPYGNLLWLGNNYYDGTKFVYEKAGYATQLQVETNTAGVFAFYVAPYGSAGATVNSITAMIIKNNGYVGIGKNTANAQLDVSGSAIISGSLTVTSSVSITDVLTLPPQNPLPSGKPTGSLAVSGSGANCKIYFFNGSWNALF